MPKVVIGLDVGDCLSRRDVPEASGDRCYPATTEGAYAFLVLFVAEHGPDSVHLISRTNTANWYSWCGNTCIEHWVVRFAKQLGLLELGVPEDHIHLTRHRTGKRGKGPVAKRLGLTHMVDNDLECLWSTLYDPCGNASDTMEKVIQFTGLSPRCIGWPPDGANRLVTLRTWHDVAKHFNLPCTDTVWEGLCKRGPPHCPPIQAPAAECVRLVMAAGAPAPGLHDTGETGSPPQTGSPRPSVGRCSLGQSSASQHAPSAVQDQIATLTANVIELKEQIANLTAMHEQTASTASTAQKAAAAAQATATQWAAQLKGAETQTVSKASATDDEELPPRRGAAASSSSGAAPPEPPPWSHWKSAATQGRAWLARKARRAELHSQGFLPSRGSSTRTEMCGMCWKNQPGKYCELNLCRVCCTWKRRNTGDACEQHDWQ